MMGRAGHVLFVVGLAVWVGGLVVLGAVAAPHLFQSLPTEQAADLFGRILRTFGWVTFACGAVAMAGASLMYVAAPRGGVLPWLRIVLLSVMLFIALGAQFGVHPKIAELRHDPSKRSEFETYHKTSERLALLNLILGLSLLASSAPSRKS